MRKISRLVAGFALVAGSALGFGCDTSIDKRIDCRQICDKANTCLGNVNLDECRKSCRDDAADNDVDKCENCLDDNSCASCADDCAAVGLSTFF
jgi:hypothetical protein